MNVPACRQCSDHAVYNGRCLRHLFPNAHEVVLNYVRGYQGINSDRVDQFAERVIDLGMSYDLEADVARAILESIDWESTKIEIADWVEDKIYDTVQIKSSKQTTRTFQRVGKRSAGKKR